MKKTWDYVEKTAIAVIIANMLTGICYAVAHYSGWIEEINYLEIFAVWTSFACTYLCVVQSRLNYYFGIVSVIALSYLFYSAELYGSMALNLYLIPTLAYGWWFWGPDDKTAIVTKFLDKSTNWRLVFSGIVAVTFCITYYISYALGGQMAHADAGILVLSIAAQFLLDRKVLENWMIWITVNVISIPLYFSQGLYVLSLQFVFFLINAIIGYVVWRKSIKKNDEIEYGLTFPNYPRIPRDYAEG